MPDPGSGPERSVLLSVHPRFADALMDGSKTVEIRRRRAHLHPGMVALLYATAPRYELVGALQVDQVIVAGLDELWRGYGPQTALSREEFDRYLDGRPEACAISVGDTVRFADPISLNELRDRYQGFAPPQSYRFVPAAESRCILNGEAVELAHLGAGA